MIFIIKFNFLIYLLYFRLPMYSMWCLDKLFKGLFLFGLCYYIYQHLFADFVNDFAGHYAGYNETNTLITINASNLTTHIGGILDDVVAAKLQTL